QTVIGNHPNNNRIICLYVSQTPTTSTNQSNLSVDQLEQFILVRKCFTITPPLLLDSSATDDDQPATTGYHQHRYRSILEPRRNHLRRQLDQSPNQFTRKASYLEEEITTTTTSTSSPLEEGGS